MNHILPKRRNMNRLYRLIRKIYKNGFFEFIENFGQRIFFITSTNDNIVAVIDPYEKIDIFYGEAGLLTCHHLFSGDSRNLRKHGLTNISIEKTLLNEHNISGLNYYMDKYRMYKPTDSTVMAYVANRPGEGPIVFDDDEVLRCIWLLEKLLIVYKKIKKKELSFDEDMVCVFDFKDSRRKFDATYSTLESYDFIPNVYIKDKGRSHLSFKEGDFEVNSGTMYIGHMYCFSSFETYNDLTHFPINLSPILLYGITTEGDTYYTFYTTPYESRELVMADVFISFFQNNGLYDTIVTDNLYVYQTLKGPLKELGIEVILNYENNYNTFMYLFLSRIIASNVDMESVLEFLEINTPNIKQMISNNKDNMEEFMESFFSDEEVIVEEDEEFDFDDDDDDGGYVS